MPLPGQGCIDIEDKAGKPVTLNYSITAQVTNPMNVFRIQTCVQYVSPASLQLPPALTLPHPQVLLAPALAATAICLRCTQQQGLVYMCRPLV
jgi:hypothetical protein